MIKDLIKTVSQTKYPLEAFVFVQHGLDATVTATHGKSKGPDDTTNRHITGSQLCKGLRDFAIQQYGLMAKPVLKRWKVNSCKDFGHIVFALVDAGLMHKTEEDSIHDFTDAFDFEEAFSPDLQLSENC